MKTTIVATILLAAASCSGAPPQLEGDPFQPPPSAPLCWGATSNSLPKAFWVYRVMPKAFSGAQMSNAIALGRLQAARLVTPPVPIPDRQLSYFQDAAAGAQRHLAIAPTLGSMEYYAGVSLREPAVEVPSEELAKSLAFSCLFALGIDRSQIADTYRNSGTATGGKLDQHGQRLTTTTLRRGVALFRRIDGVQVAAPCFRVVFGNHARITQFTLTWRNLIPDAAYQAAGPEQLTDRIKAGRAVAPPQDFDLATLAQARRLVVAKATPFYYDKPGLTPLDLVFPFAELELRAEMPETTNTVFVQVPILLTNIVAGLDN